MIPINATQEVLFMSDKGNVVDLSEKKRERAGYKKPAGFKPLPSSQVTPEMIRTLDEDPYKDYEQDNTTD
jgi:hypothetical protein